MSDSDALALIKCSEKSDPVMVSNHVPREMPMDSFGTWRKLKLILFFLLMQNFIELYELLMPC